jgi:hypothetical protein
MDVIWRQPDFELHVDQSHGEVKFDAGGGGRAHLAASRLNREEVELPINIQAQFTPGAGRQFHHVALDVPRISLTALNLQRFLGGQVTAGWFKGTLTYREQEDVPSLSLRGSIGDARLEELTRRLPGGPWHGRADIDIYEATVSRRRLLSLNFDGELRDIRLGDLSTLFNQPELDGRINLCVQQARYRDDRLIHLSGFADATNVSMAAVTRLLGHGEITGDLRVTVRSLLIEDNDLRRAEVDLEVIPPVKESGTIDREMILYAAEKVLGVDLGRAGQLLPERVEYAKLGCKLIVDGDVLTVRGLHGADGRTILTVRVFEQELGLIRQTDEAYPVADVLEHIRRRIADYNVEEFMKWWNER